MPRKTKSKPALCKPFKSFNDINERARNGEVAAQLCCIAALENLGCEHLADPYLRRQTGVTKWQAHYYGLQDYVGSLASEYGMREDKAYKEVLAEVNNMRDCIDQVTLT